MAELKILEEKENPLFNRKEIQAQIIVEVIPSNSETEKLLAEKFSVPVENIKIKKIASKFGSQKFIITSNIYSSEEEKNNIEEKKKKVKSKEAA